jgi:hypothetical protein
MKWARRVSGLVSAVTGARREHTGIRSQRVGCLDADEAGVTAGGKYADGKYKASQERRLKGSVRLIGPPIRRPGPPGNLASDARHAGQQNRRKAPKIEI